MAGVTTVRHRSVAPRLTVTPPSGTNERFVRQLCGDTVRHHRSSRLRTAWMRLTSAVRGRVGKGRNDNRSRRTPVLLGVLGIFAATFLMGIAGTPDRGMEIGGGTSVARAAEGDCIDENTDIPIIPGWAEGAIKGPINLVCRAFREAGRIISENILTPIGDRIWKTFHPNKFCFTSRTDISIDDPNNGLNSLMKGTAEFLIGKDDKAFADTTWREYGTAGTYWGTYFLDCYDSLHISNLGANFVFGVSKIFAMIALLLFQQTFNSAIVDYFFVPQGDPPAPEAAIDTIIKQLHFSFFVNMMAVAVVIGGIVVLYRSVVLGGGPGGGGLADAVSKIAIMAVVVGVALTYVTYGSDYIQKASGYTDDFGEAVLGALSGEGCKKSNGESVSGNPDPYDCAAQTMYHVLIYVPWANGEIGTIDVVNDAAYTQQRRKLAYDILQQQAYNQGESNQINDPNLGEDQRVQNTERIRNEKNDNRLRMVRDDWGARFIENPEEQGKVFAITGEDSWRPHDHVDTDYPEYWNLFSGKLAGQRFIIAIMALIGSISLGLVLISIATAYIVLQLMTIILALAAPVVFLVGIVPGYGYRIFLKWFELLAGLFVKRLALVVFVGVLLAGLQLVFKVQAPWWLHMLAAVCVGLVGIAYRHQLASWASTGMEGMGKVAGVATGGLLGMRDGLKSIKHAKATWNSNKDLPMRHRAKAAAGAAYNAHQTGPHQAAYTQQRVYTQSQRRAVAAGQPRSRRRRKARKAIQQQGPPGYQQQLPPDTIEAPPNGAQTGMGPGRSSRHGTYVYRG